MGEPNPQMSPTSFGFLLLNDFTLISMSSAIETLRMANRLSDERVYTWSLISVDGSPITASDGLSINVDFSFADEAELRRLDAIVVCGGERVERNAVEPALRWLRGCNQLGLALGSTCTGSFALAKAGLLDGYHCSIHWENHAAMTVAFPQVHVGRGVYTIDRNRFTSSGGTAPIDMMLYFVRQRCGAEVSAGVADQFVYDRVRDPRDLQRVPLRHVAGRQSAELVAAVELMEGNIREPISHVELASYVGLSRRQLQRLFQKYLACTPSRYYLQLRLRRARELLFQSDLSLVEISAQAGFVSSSHFSKAYKEFYGMAPSADRRQAST